MAVALLLCLALTVEAASKQEKKKADEVVTHKVGRTQPLDLHTCCPTSAQRPALFLRVMQVFFDIEIDGKAEGEAAPATAQLQVNQQ